MKSTLCSTCQGEIIFARTITGKRMPVDAKPVANGNMVLKMVTPEGDERPYLLASVLPPAELAQHTERFISHFASCRDSAQHRRSR